MSTLTVPVPTGEFRRRSLSGDRNFHFKRKKTSDSLEHPSVLNKLITGFLLRKIIFAMIVIFVVLAYFSVSLTISYRDMSTGKESMDSDMDLCSLTAKSANIYNDIKRVKMTGRLAELSYIRAREDLLQSFDFTKKHKSPFENASYPTKGDMRVILQRHKEGKTTDEEKINKYPFSFILNPSGQCDETPNSEQNIYLLFIIKSLSSHSRRRNVIRNTWTNNTFINGYTVKRIFIFGQGNDSNDVNAALKSEAALFGDILQMNLVDSHRNSTWKSRGGLKWASENCFGAKYVMLVDDDYYVATDLVIQLLEFTGKLDNLYMGVVNWRPSPFRSKVSKWYISPEEYPYPVYPAFVSSSALLMSMDFVINFNIASMYTKHFIFDDVFLAIVASKLNVSPISNKLFYRGNIPYINKLFETTLACHGFDTPTGLYNAWMIHMLVRCYGRNIVNHFLMKTGNRRSNLPDLGRLYRS